LVTVLDQLLSKQRDLLWLVLGHLGDKGIHDLFRRRGRRRHRFTVSNNDERKSDGHGKSRIHHLINQSTHIVELGHEWRRIHGHQKPLEKGITEWRKGWLLHRAESFDIRSTRPFNVMVSNMSMRPHRVVIMRIRVMVVTTLMVRPHTVMILPVVTFMSFLIMGVPVVAFVVVMTMPVTCMVSVGMVVAVVVAVVVA
jgi:hypothetical protein